MEGRLRGWRGDFAEIEVPRSFFLLYLNQKTWLGAAGSKLADQVPRPAREPNVSHTPVTRSTRRITPLQPAVPLHTEQVRAARAAGIRVILAHECDPTLGGCEFSSFFQTTPQDLIADGLYARVAVAFHTGQHRAVSLCLLARELGAARYRTKWALKSRGHAAVDAANLHPSTALVFSRNSSGASSRAALPVEAEHLSRASSCLESPFEDPPGNEGSEPEGEGRSGRLSLARGQLVASGTEPDLTLQSVVRGQAASSEGRPQSLASAMGAAQHLPGAFDSTDDEQGEVAAVAQEKVAEEGNQHHADDASVGAIGEDGLARARQTTDVMRV